MVLGTLLIHMHMMEAECASGTIKCTESTVK